MSTEKKSTTNNLDKFKKALTAIYNIIKKSNSFQEGISEVEKDILNLIKAERMTIYQSLSNGIEIQSVFKSSGEKKEIRVPYSTTSVSGWVALSNKSVIIKDLDDHQELQRIHPDLKYDSSFSKASGFIEKNMICVPIKEGKVFLGVLQFTNCTDGSEFTIDDAKNAILIAQMLAQKFRTDLQSTQSPLHYLVKQGKITQDEMLKIEQYDTAQTGNSYIKILSEKGVSKKDIGKSLEQYYQVPFMTYRNDVLLPEIFFKDVKRSYLRNKKCVPIQGDKQEVVILIDDPSDHDKIVEIQNILQSKSYIFRVALEEDIMKYLSDEHKIKSTEKARITEELINEKKQNVEFSLDGLKSAQSTANIHMVDNVIKEAHRLGASDIHIEPGEDEILGTIRVRVDGSCRQLATVPSDNYDSIIARIKVMSKLDISERRKPQDGKCKVMVRGSDLELRIATVPTVHGESIVMRLLSSGEALPLDKLNLAPKILNKIYEVCKHHHGLFLVSGPTGSGKTTTLHAILNHLNTPDKKIWTAEDPVEITQPGLQQLQINNKIDLTFSNAIRAFMRADPDIILIGEMRDAETANIGIEASLTGHLVLSTLHTNSAPDTITRLLNLGIERVNFTDSLLGVLAQRLVRTLCSECKSSYRPDDKEMNHLIEIYGKEDFENDGYQADQIKLYKPTGCEECGLTGYKGRTGLHEMLVVSSELQQLIYDEASLQVITQQAYKDGMRTLLQDGTYKVFKGEIDYSSLISAVSE